MEPTSPEMQEITEAAATLQRGEREQGRTMLLALWDKLSAHGDPLQLCTIAHFLADTEANVADELEWDLRALEAATGSRDADGGNADGGDSGAVPPSFLASLYLNVADASRRRGEVDAARRYARVASDKVDALPDDPYGRMIKGGLLRLEARLAAGEL
ncbi:MAG TPA: hypothetical protein VGL66_15540 [Caulobacteraceae bacterium]|jgi:hypothetical protein